MTVTHRLFGERTVHRDDRAWLTAAIAVGGIVYVAYLATHEYPAYGGGLYLEIAEQIRLHDYRLPERVPGYTEDGVPFAYPPLAFYVAALVVDVTGVDGFTYARVAPGAFVIASLVPYYYTAKELLGTTPRAGVATLVFATAPPALQWHLSAGGMVRSMAMVVVLTGTYTGVRLFRDGDRRWLLASTVLFGLAVSTHPTYAVLFGLTYLLLFAAFDRTTRGLGRGAVVALGGLALAAPWWTQVVSVHGPDVFTGAAGTLSGLVGGVDRIARVFGVDPKLTAMFYLLAYAGAVYGLERRRYFLVAWLALSGYVIGKSRVLFVAGGMLAALVVLDGLLPTIRDWNGSEWVVPVTVALTLALAGTGIVYAGGQIEAHGESATQPAFVDHEDVVAMEWASDNTDGSADFVVLGDAAEWFPHRTDRTILVGPWGVEWVSTARYYQQLGLFKRISACHTATCLSANLDAAGVEPEYVYVPKGHYTVRGFGEDQRASMRRSMVASGRYELVHENDGVLVFRTTR